MKSALLGLAVAVLAACGSVPEPEGPTPAAAAESRPEAARTPVPHFVKLPPQHVAPSEPGEPEPAPTPVVHVVVLPTYEVIRRTASHDDKSWCILDVRLEKTAPDEMLRALWQEMRRQEPTDWGRFTCRLHASDSESSVDVNEFMIFSAVALDEPPVNPRLGEIPGTDDIVIVEEGEDYVIYEVEGVEIRIPKRR